MDEYNPYTDNGFSTREEYLKDLAAEYGVPEHLVFEVAALYGPNEDFDGLVTWVQDYEEGY